MAWGWEAVSALATAAAAFGTFAAVIVALLPLHRERAARRAKARALRAQLVLHLMGLTPLLTKRRIEQNPSPLTADEKSEIGALTPLLSQADLLTPDEFDAVVTAGAHLSALRAMSYPPEADILTKANEAVVRAAALIVKSQGVLHKTPSVDSGIAK